jgi:hypothetical protein
MQLLVVAVLVFAVAARALDQILHLKGSWEDTGRMLASNDEGQRRVARIAVGYWLQSAGILALGVLVAVLAATGHAKVSFP